LSLPDDLKMDNAAVVLFTQDEQTKAVQALKQFIL